MILSYNELRQDIQAARVLSPIEDSQINASSIDVRLGGRILVERANPKGVQTVVLRDRETLDFEEVDISAKGAIPFILKPGQFILAHTIEVFNLPLDISAEFKLNSSAARMGLSHALAVWADAGWHGSVLTLELHNISQQHAIQLHFGDRIGQMVFHRHARVPKDRGYGSRGAYNKSPSVMPAQKNGRSKAPPAIPALLQEPAKPWEA